MTVKELSVRLGFGSFGHLAEQVLRAKLSFVLNLFPANQEFTEEQLINARDALIVGRERDYISDSLKLRPPRKQKLAEPDAPTTMPLSACENIPVHRLVCFLRPDPKMVVEIEKREIDTEPRVHVYQVVVEDGRGGGWNEVFTSEETLKAFLRGIRVTFAMSDLQRLLPEFGDDAPLEFKGYSSYETQI